MAARAQTTQQQSAGASRLAARRDPGTGSSSRDDTGELNVAEIGRRKLADLCAKLGKRESLRRAVAGARKGMTHISRLLTAAGLTTVHHAGAGRDRVLAHEVPTGRRLAAPFLCDDRGYDISAAKGDGRLHRIRQNGSSWRS
jgi:hypothetical protein